MWPDFGLAVSIGSYPRGPLVSHLTQYGPMCKVPRPPPPPLLIQRWTFEWNRDLTCWEVGSSGFACRAEAVEARRSRRSTYNSGNEAHGTHRHAACSPWERVILSTDLIRSLPLCNGHTSIDKLLATLPESQAHCA